MRYIFLLSLLFLNIFLVSAETNVDTANVAKEKDALPVRPYGEVGVNVFLNKQLVKNYSTNAAFYWALGVRIGKPNLNEVNMFVQYSNSKVTNSEYYNGSNGHIADSTLKMSQFSIGLIFPLIVIDDQASLKTRISYTLNDIQDSYYSYGGTLYNGCSLGLGFERKMQANFKVYIEGSYNFIRVPGTVYYNNGLQVKSLNNMNTFRLTFGLNI